MCLTLLACRWMGGDAPPIHQPLVGGDPPEHIGLDRHHIAIPEPLSQRTRPDPDLNVMCVVVGYFAPETGLGAQHILLILVVLDGFLEVAAVELHPGDEATIPHPEIVAHSHIQVVGAVVGDHHFAVGVGQASAPPVDHVLLVEVDLGVHPVHGAL